jgi:hypothetical protein
MRYYLQAIEEASLENHNFNQDDFAYPWLNFVFTEMLSEGKGSLRPHFAWGVLHGAHLAKAIGIQRVSVMEFGVAGGNGLVSLEKVAEKVEKVLGIGIDVYGFDTGAGLPKPEDYRDMPNLYVENAFPMDVDRLKKRLTRAQLVLGLVEHTVPEFLQSRPAPVAFMAIDLDYYSSTRHALQLLEADDPLLLPRIHCYFDDIMGFTCSEYTGERLAITDFNTEHEMRKISSIYGLKYHLPSQFAQEKWLEMMYMAHLFDHDLYNRHDGLVKRYAGDGTQLKHQ